MSISSEDSLSELPLPYDISSAVSRALRINSASDEASSSYVHHHPRSVHPSNFLTANDDVHEASKEPRRASYSYYQSEYPYQSYSHRSQYQAISYEPTLNYSNRSAHMEMDTYPDITTVTICSSSEDLLNSDANADQLDQFCRFIGCNDEEEPFSTQAVKPEPGPMHHLHDRRYTITGGDVIVPRAGEELMRKKIRSCGSLSHYDEDMYVTVPPVNPYPSARHWDARLENVNLWRQFDQIGTEMVITKGGRRMFPSMVVSFSGLDPSAIYSLRLEILPTDGKRYKFLQTEWVPVGKADKKQVYRDYIHPDSPNNGAFWMDQEINFKLVKLTNNKSTKHADQMVLNSMQKYQPRLQLTCETTGATQAFYFPETRFIAVTAYQNSQITQLKIKNNPYARAFREGISLDGSLNEKKGGHYKLRETSSSPMGKLREESTGPNHSPSPSPVKRHITTMPHRHSSTDVTKCTSAVSVESGFESGDSGELVRPHYTLHTEVDSTMLFPTKILTQPNPFSSSSLTYWADDNSLWNPNLITPDPLMDSTGSFSEPYLRQSSVMGFSDVSPVKGLHAAESTHDMMNCTVLVDIETADDDVFF